MSYILEALKRAEAERERGSLPTLMSQTVGVDAPTPASPAPASKSGLRLAVGLAAVLGVLTLGAWLGRGLGSDEPTPAAPAPAQPAAALPEPAPRVSTEAPPVPLASRVVPPPPVMEPVPAANTPSHMAQKEPSPVLSKSASTELVAAPTAPTPATAIPALKDLPESQRRELPTLSASGAMYSETPSKRMLIINGQLLQEGARVTPDLTLEQIELKSAVLSFKGQRFRISY